MDQQATIQTDASRDEVSLLKNELHAALKTLRRADLVNDRYERIVQHLDAIVLALDPDGKILFLNDFGQKFFGYEAKELLGRQILGTLIPVATENSGRYLPEMLCRLLESPDSFETNENENTTRDGRRYLVSWKNWAIHDRQGSLAEIACLGHVLKSL